jgi:malonyl-CoA O-methyltransferase
MPAEPGFPAPDPREVDARAVRRAFGRAARTYDAAAALQREVAARMAARLDYVKLVPAAVLDAGCGTGLAVGELRARYPEARVTALDLALPMVAAARERERSGRSVLRRLLPAALAGGRESHFVCGDVNALPFAGVAFDLAWSNLALQWVNDLPRAFAEFRRVLKVGGLLTFTTFGPDTLREVRRAFARVDGFTHTNRFVDMHDLGDMLVHAGFADPVMDMEAITVTYADPESLLRELKALGATNATRGRAHGLMGRERWLRMLRALDAMRVDGRLPATFEVVYGHAWKGEPKRTAEGHPIVTFRKPE